MIKKCFVNFFQSICKIFKRLNRKKSTEGNKVVFWSLTPKNDLDLRIYEQAIDYAFERDGIRNFAISGAYGAGKSSILASYLKKHPRLKSMHISLAHYQPFAEEARKTKITVNTLELKILNQLVHQIPARKIPQTGFHVKRPVSFWRTLLWTMCIMAFVISLLYVFLFSKWVSFSSALIQSLPNYFSSVINASVQPHTRFIALVVCAFFATFILYKIINAQRLKSVIKKVKIQGSEIDLGKCEEESFFDLYLNEVRYLFENVGVDVVVFEDMDRFDIESIFERLHEINTLVNLHRKKKPIRFLYLLRDDIYMSKDRTKFFDFIIPVVPVIDASNSYNKLKEMLDKSALIEEFDDSFLQGISLYIDDMRLLLNIVNEFIIYFEELKVTEPNVNNMLAIITYKNLFPKDFCDLQLGRGYVATLFENKSSLISERRKQLTAQIEQAEDRLRKIDEEIANSEQEIDKIYSSPYYLTDNQRREKESRKQLVREKAKNHTTKIRESIVSTKNSLAELHQANLSELLDRNNIDGFMVTGEHVQRFSEVLTNEYFALLKYLIRNGYIGEQYSDYMTYFYDGSLAVTDKTFLRSITDQEAKAFSHPLKNVATILKRMRSIDFDQRESLNFDLFAYMLKYENENLPRYIAMMRSNEVTDFIVEYFGENRTIPELIQNLCKHWPVFFHQSIKNGWFDKGSLKAYSVKALLHLDSENLKKINVDDCLTEYISGTPDYLSVDCVDVAKFVDSLSAIDVVFQTLDEALSNRSLLQAVYERNMYELNAHNIVVMLHSQYGLLDDETINHRNYTAISAESNSKLMAYVKSNAEDYMKAYLELCNGWVDDSEGATISLLNNQAISLKLKIQYIEQMRTFITDIEAVTCTECWDSLVNKKRIKHSEHNLLSIFFQQEELSAPLIGYINQTQCAIDCDTIRKEFEIDSLVDFFEIMLNHNVIADEAFEYWISGLFTICEGEKDFFEVGTELNANKVRFLMDRGVIPMSPDGLCFVRQHYKQHIRYFIVRHFSTYVTIMNDSLFDHEELLELLTWPEISVDIKIELLGYASAPIPILNSNYEEPIAAFIVKNNFDDKELLQCLIDYRKYGLELQNAIIEKAASELDVVIKHAQQFDRELLVRLLNGEDDIDNRISLLIELMGVWNQEEIFNELDKCGLPEYRKLLRPHTSKTIVANTRSHKLLEAFKTAKWIESYAYDSGDESLYRVELNKKKAK